VFFAPDSSIDVARTWRSLRTRDNKARVRGKEKAREKEDKQQKEAHRTDTGDEHQAMLLGPLVDGGPVKQRRAPRKLIRGEVRVTTVEPGCVKGQLREWLRHTHTHTDIRERRERDYSREFPAEKRPAAQ
jgi:hypothetical protein